MSRRRPGGVAAALLSLCLLLPNLNANGIFANSSNQRFDQATGQLVSQNYTAQLQGSYEVFGAGRRIANLRASGAGVDAAEARFRAQKFQTILQTASLFYAAAAAADLVDVAQQRQARAQEQLDFARVRLDLGTATASDLLRAEIEVANAELASGGAPSVVAADATLKSRTMETRLHAADAVRGAERRAAERVQAFRLGGSAREESVVRVTAEEPVATS